MKLKFWEKEKKKLIRPRRYALVKFTPYSKEYCVGGIENMKIAVYQGNRLIGVNDFSFKRIQQLEERGIPVVFEETGHLPKECMIKKPEIYYVFGKLRFE